VRRSFERAALAALALCVLRVAQRLRAARPGGARTPFRRRAEEHHHPLTAMALPRRNGSSALHTPHASRSRFRARRCRPEAGNARDGHHALRDFAGDRFRGSSLGALHRPRDEQRHDRRSPPAASRCARPGRVSVPRLPGQHRRRTSAAQADRRPLGCFAQAHARWSSCRTRCGGPGLRNAVMPGLIRHPASLNAAGFRITSATAGPE
jgi:hypothetical protein